MTHSRGDTHIHIEAKQGLFDLRLKEVWDYRDLIYLFTKRNFIVIYKQTILGPLWLILQPLISCLIYMFIFGYVAGIGTEGVPKMLFYIFGNALWILFSESASECAQSVILNANILGKVYFPRLTIPISCVIGAMLRCLIQMMIGVGLMIYYAAIGQVSVNVGGLILLIPVFLNVMLLAFGAGILAAALTTKYRDLSVVIKYIVQIWMYLTPVVYPLSVFASGKLQFIMSLNPMTAPMEMMRYALWGTGSMNALSIVVSWAVTIFLLLVGLILFNRAQRTFTDTI